MKAALRKIRLNLGRLLFDKAVQPSENLQLNKILIIRTDDKIGDYVVSSFIFREIKKFHPNSEISVIATANTFQLFSNNRFVDHIYTVKPKSILEYCTTALLLRKENFDVVIDLTLIFRNRDLLLLRLLNAKNYLGFHKQNYKIFNLNIPLQMVHYREIYVQALNKLGMQGVDSSYQFTTQHRTSDAENVLTQIKNPFVVVNFFGAGRARCFNESKIKQVLELLAKYDLNYIFLSMPHNRAMLATQLAPYPNMQAPEINDLFTVKDLLVKSCFVITPDTSIVHIANAFKIALFAFYSDDEMNFAHWHPIANNKQEILRYQGNINNLDLTVFKQQLTSFIKGVTNMKTIYLAGGCFWGVEHFLKQIPGVVKTECGYANGSTPSPSYQDVVAGSGHAEVVKVEFDPEKLSLESLIELYFKIIDPTSLNKQGPDEGVQYRTGIYFVDEADESVITERLLNLQKNIKNQVVVENLKLENYHTAEDYHQNYLIVNPQGYCHLDKKLISEIIDDYCKKQ